MYNTYGYYKTAVAEMLHYLVLFEDKHHKLLIPHQSTIKKKKRDQL